MAWVYLVIAGLLEVAWAIGLKKTEGWTQLWPSVLTLLGMLASFYFLAQAVRTIPIGTGYAMWTGIGAAGTAVASVYVFDESMTLAQMLCLTMVIGGIVGLKITSV